MAVQHQAQAVRASIGLGAALLGLCLPLGNGLLPFTDRAATTVDRSPRLLVSASPAPAHEAIPSAVSSMFDDVQRTWTQLFSSMGKRYVEARMVIFRESVKSACGYSHPATGSFYCPTDQTVYVDLGIYQGLREHFGEPGELGHAFVLAHEIGHHVQTLLGIEERVRQLRATQPGAADQLSTRVEAQADCLSGLWWYFTPRRTLEPADIEGALHAAAAIGAVRWDGVSAGDAPDAFTHETSLQRVSSFKRGLQSGQVSACEISSG